MKCKIKQRIFKKGVSFLQNNAIPRIAAITLKKLFELKYTFYCICHIAQIYGRVNTIYSNY